MVAPWKKRKVEETDATRIKDSGKDPSTSGIVSSPPSLAALDRLLDQFVDSLEDIQEASCKLLSVKDFQRTVLGRLDETAAALEERHSQVERHRTTLANLQYEQGHWEAKIQHLKSSSKTPQLEALCREELDDNLSDPSVVLTKFLGHDISQVDHSQEQVVALLHQQINTRGTLERDLAQRNKELINLTNIQKKRAQFLHQLPDKLKDMEKASLPLQRFFAAASRGKPTSLEDGEASLVSTPKYNTTSERDARLQLAQQLAGPLYTLFVQLQAYLDDYPHKNMTLDIGPPSAVVKTGSSSTNTLWTNPNEKVVLWQIPVPTIQVSQSPQTAAAAAAAKPKFLTVAFTFFEEWQVVTAKVIGGEDKLDVASVLQLNPLDSGEFRIHKLELEKGPEEERAAADAKQDESMDSPIYGKPYLWCNYLAGLQILAAGITGFSSSQPPLLQSSSTRVIVAEVLRRLKASATLHHILHKLLPSFPRAQALLPNASPSNSSTHLAKVSSFQLDTSVTATSPSSTTVRTYKLVCKRGNHTLPMTVQFDPSCYPILAPPVWSLTSNTLQWGEDHGSCEALLEGGAAPPLHQARLAAMEAKVNDIDGLIETLKQQDENSKNDGSSKEDSELESYYYDWILTHQLREIMVEWEDWVMMMNDGGENAGTAAVRTMRGRDRAKVE